MANYEIERKFSFPNKNENISDFVNPSLEFKESHLIEQWYLVATDTAQVRISKRYEKDGNRYTLNIKNSIGLKRKEVMIDVTYKDFIALINQCDGVKPISKFLFVYYLPNGRLLELSKVDESWRYAEVEFGSEEEASAFNIEDCFMCPVKEETGNPEYMMKNYWRNTRL